MKEKGKCSCAAFYKNYTCKHHIGIAKRLCFVFIPNVTKNVPIGQKRQRGRPVQINKALEYQPDQVPVRMSENAKTTTMAVASSNYFIKKTYDIG